jgi:hypothetical protein
LLRSWIGAVGLEKSTAWVSVPGEERDPQRFWISVLDSLRQTAAGSALVRPLSAAPDLDGWAVVVPPGKGQRAAMPPILLKVIAEWRNRIEATFSEITDRMELARHGAHTFEGLLTRTAATIAAHTLLLTCLTAA